jgi:hypothetical protein
MIEYAFKTLTDRIIKIEINSARTFGELREKVSLASGMPQNEMRIIYSGKLLDASYDNQIIANIDMRHPRSNNPKPEKLCDINHMALIQTAFLNLPHNGITIEDPKVYWRIRQIPDFNANSNYALDENKTELTGGVTVYDTLASALEGAKLRQSHNTSNGLTAVIEAVILDNAQLNAKISNQNAVAKMPQDAKKYGDAFILIPLSENYDLKLSTIGYFKQGSARFVTLRETPMLEKRHLNKGILEEVHLAIQSLFTSPTTNLTNHRSFASVSPANNSSHSSNTSNSSRVAASQDQNSVSSAQSNDARQFFKPNSSTFKHGSLRAKLFEELQDPIGFDLFVNPMILPTGQTFNKTVLNNLPSDFQGRKKCPTTRALFFLGEARENKLLSQILKLLAETTKQSDEVFMQKLETLLNASSPQANWKNLVEPVVQPDGTTYNKGNSSATVPYTDYRLKNIINLFRIEYLSVLPQAPANATSIITPVNSMPQKNKLLVLDVEGTIIEKYLNNYDKVETSLKNLGIAAAEAKTIVSSYQAKQEIVEGMEIKPVINPQLSMLLSNFREQGFLIVLNTGAGDAESMYRKMFEDLGIACYIDHYSSKNNPPNLGKEQRLNRYCEELKIDRHNVYFYDDGESVIRKAQIAGFTNSYQVDSNNTLDKQLIILQARLKKEESVVMPNSPGAFAPAAMQNPTFYPLPVSNNTVQSGYVVYPNIYAGQNAYQPPILNYAVQPGYYPTYPHGSYGYAWPQYPIPYSPPTTANYVMPSYPTLPAPSPLPLNQGLVENSAFYPSPISQSLPAQPQPQQPSVPNNNTYNIKGPNL